MIKINLTPVELLDKAKQKQQIIQASMIGAVVAVLVAGMSTLHFMAARSVEADLTVAKAKLKKLDLIVKKVQDLERTAASVRSRLKVIDDLLTGRPLYPYFMSDFSSVIPGGVFIKTMSTVTDPDKKLKLAISAESRTSEEILEWITAMVDSKKFIKPLLGPVAAGGSTGEKTYTFTINTTYVPDFGQ